MTAKDFLPILALLGIVIVVGRRRVILPGMATRLHGREGFWRARRRLKLIAFSLARLRYRAQFGRQRSLLTIAVSWQFARKALLAAALAVGLVVLIYRAEDFLLHTIEESQWMARHLSWLARIPTRDELVSPALYNAVLGTAIGVLGVFIALFSGVFTTSSDVLSARVALTARQLLLRDPQVGFIARLFSGTVMTSLVLLVAEGAGARPTLLGLLIVSFLTGLAVLVAALLVRQGFYFLNPTRLVEVPLRDLIRFARLATPSGFQFRDPSFQNSYRIWANTSLQEVQVLWRSELDAQSLQDENLAAIQRTVLRFIGYYTGLRNRMPTASHWHAREPRHKDWYLTPHTRVTTALATDTPLQPDLEPNRFWVEDSILLSLVASIRASLERGSGAGAVSVMDSVSAFVHKLGEEWEVEYANKWTLAIAPAVLDLLGTPWQPTPDQLDQKDDYRLALIDGVSLLPVAALLGVLKAARGLDLQNLHTQIEQLRWKHDIYALGLPHQAKETAEDLQKRIEFEIGGSGHRVTPSWYAEQLILRTLGQQLAESLQYLETIPERFYKTNAKKAFASNQWIVAATILGRGVEFCHKFLANLDAADRFSKHIDDAVILSDLPWPKFDSESTRKTIEVIRLDLLEMFCSCIPGLYVMERPQNWPDLFGRAVHTAGDICLESAIEKRTDSLKKTFASYLIGVAGVYERLRKLVAEDDPQRGMAWATEPLLDLFEISGYIILMSELHEDPSIWQVCRESWEKYLSTVDKRALLEFFSVVVSFNESLFGSVRLRAMLRTGWKARVERVLEKVPRRWVDRGFTAHQVSVHPSTLVETFAREAPMGSMYNGLDIFVELYLQNIDGAEGLDFHQRLRLLDSLHDRDDDTLTRTNELIRRVTGK